MSGSRPAAAGLVLAIALALTLPPAVARAVVPPGLQAFTTWEATGDIAVSPSAVVTANRVWVSPAPYNQGTTDMFFGLRDFNRDGVGAPNVEYSVTRGRFVAVVPTWRVDKSWYPSCTDGAVIIAVSSGPDPTKPWTRFRVPLADAWPTRVSLGLSDDKVVIATEESDIASVPTCIGSTSEGTRIRAIDWADLLDGGSLTVRDVSPSPRTDFRGWTAATKVPSTVTTATGGNVYLVGERRVDDAWGHLAYAVVSGGARARTAKTTTLDLTATLGVAPLTGAQPSILAFGSGNGGQVDAPVSASWRLRRLVVSANAICRPAGDDADRSCARLVELDTTASVPTVVADVTRSKAGSDLFHPVVGFSRDGSLYASMNESSAVTAGTVDQVASYRDPGEPLAGLSEPVRVIPGGIPEPPFARLYPDWPSRSVGAMGPDPVRSRVAWHASAAGSPVHGSPAYTRLDHGLTGAPAGRAWPDLPDGWLDSFDGWLDQAPDPASPIVLARVSASPVTESTADGPRLVLGTDQPAGALLALDLDDPAVGGEAVDGLRSFYVQWRTSDGTWSPPVQGTIGVDVTRPVVTSLRGAFARGATVGSTALVRFAWSVLETQSGVRYSYLYLGGTSHPQLPTAAYSTRLAVGRPFEARVWVTDRAGNGSAPQTRLTGTPTITPDGAAAITYGPGWSRRPNTAYLGGSVRYATAPGARATFAFTGQAVGLVATRAPSRGSADVWVDGVRVATVNLHTATTTHRTVVWQTTWSAPGAHTVELVVVGTPGSPGVDVDAFVTH
jgi:hypothetical protein